MGKPCYRIAGLSALALALALGGCVGIDAGQSKARGRTGPADPSLQAEPPPGETLSGGLAQIEFLDEEGPEPGEVAPREQGSEGPAVVPEPGVTLPEALPPLGPPVLQAEPARVVMRGVQPKTFRAQTLRLRAEGERPIRLLSFELAGSDTFSAELHGVLGREAPLRVAEHVHLDPGAVLLPGDAKELRVIFAPFDKDRHDAVLRVGWIARERGETLEVPLVGNDRGPCMRAEPPVLSFGARRFGSATELPLLLHSCGEAPLLVESITLEDAGGGSFEIVAGSLAVGTLPRPGWEIEEAHFVVPSQIHASFAVRYSPRAGSSPDYESGLRETAYLKVRAEGLAEETSVRLEGAGTSKGCPMARVAMLEPEPASLPQAQMLGSGGTGVAAVVPPQTTLILSGEHSVPSAGEIAEYAWEALQPEGSASVFYPDAGSEKVYFETNAAGRYVFRLKVKDDEGWSCVGAERHVLVVADEALHVELTWHTPGDEDPVDIGQGAGSDMDLHFVHLDNALKNPHGEDLWPPPRGDGVPEGWFDDLWDTFWFYVTHDWGRISDGDDDPSLDRDDVDGAGPENLNLHIPEGSVTYKIGVHYWNDHGFGPSTPCVRVMVYGVERASVCGCPMERFDLWEVGSLTWGERPFEVTGCTAAVPPAEGEPWPERPCGTEHNRYPDGRACDRLVMPSYEPEKFVFDF